jgi:CheY-like chemotaxis protein
MAEADIELFKSWVEIHPLVERVFSIAKPLAANKQLQLINSTSPDERVWADPNRLEQILLNLVSNGIKYSDAGSVAVISQRYTDSLQFIVHDTGIGIAPEDIPKLFVPFNQLDASANRRSGGTGLGLTVTRYLIEQHGGKIKVESTPGKGSRFIVDFPLSTSEPEQEQAAIALAASPLNAPDLRGKTLLFADDDTINCMILYKQLKHTDAYLLEANNGLKAWEILQEHIPIDLVILDLQMPQLDGFEVAKNMRTTEQWRRTPIIFLSANITEQDLQLTQSLAPARLLLKPVTKNLLWQQLMELIETSR